MDQLIRSNEEARLYFYQAGDALTLTPTLAPNPNPDPNPDWFYLYQAGDARSYSFTASHPQVTNPGLIAQRST